MFSELNKQVTTIKEGIKLEDLEFAPLKNFVGKEIAVDGFFFTEGKYGTQVVVVGNSYKINMPARAVETFQKIKDDEVMLKAVLEGHLKLTDIKSIATKNGNTTGYRLTDC